jgi:magnesium transporter
VNTHFKMAKFTRRYNRKRVGLPPGSTEHLSAGKEDVLIEVVKFSEDFFTKKTYKNINDPEIFTCAENQVLWVNIFGLQKENVEFVGQKLNIHSLFIEDILHTGQRPKLDEAGDYLYMVMNMLHTNNDSYEISAEQISFIFNQKCLITFQEREGDVFDIIRHRLEVAKGRIRKNGADYLAYTLLDLMVDQFYVILENLGNKIEELEERVMEQPSIELLQDINKLKKEFIYLRKNIWPLREVINGLMRTEQLIISKNTRFYVKDIYDHTIQIMDSIETYREMLSSILDIYMSSVSNRLNNVMKTLTIIATIFIPLTFLVGVYGMNFRVMPELDWEYGYYLIWAIMIISATSLLIYFKRKNWL